MTRITPENSAKEASLDIRTLYTAVGVLVGALKALTPAEREEVLRGLDS